MILFKRSPHDQSVRPVPEARSFLPSALQRRDPLRLGVISNPLSGGNRGGLRCVRDLLTGQSRAYHCEASTPDTIASALAELAGKGVSIVAVNGGDGTVHAVLTALFHRPAQERPLLAVLRSGTASMIAGDVGLQESSRKALHRLLAFINTGRGSATVVERPVLKVESGSDQKVLYGMFFGAGGICQGIRYCLDCVLSRGMSVPAAAVLTMGRFLIAAARRDKKVLIPVPAAISLDGEPLPQRNYLFMLFTTLERLFLGLRPYWGTENAPLHYTSLDARARHFYQVFFPFLRGGKSRFASSEHGYCSRKVHEAEITVPGGFTVDGELYGQHEPANRITLAEGGRACFLRW